MEEEKVGRSLSLSEILLVVRTNIIWILLIIAVSLSVGIAYIELIQKTTYTATVGFYVNAEMAYKEEGINISEHTAYQYSALIAPEYEKVLKSKNMREYINEKFKENQDADISALNFSNIKFVYTEGSAFFDITYSYSVHDGDYATIAKQISKSLNFYVKNAVEKLDNDTIDRNSDSNADGYKYGVLRNKLVVIADADESTVTQSSDSFKTLFLAFAIGIVIAAIFVLLVYFIDDTISSREDIERVIDVPTLAYIDISTNATLSSEKPKSKAVFYSNKGGK